MDIYKNLTAEVDRPELCSWWTESGRQCRRTVGAWPPEPGLPRIPLCRQHEMSVVAWSDGRLWRPVEEKTTLRDKRQRELDSLDAQIQALRFSLQQLWGQESFVPYVYVLRRADGLVKIGYTTDVRQRLKAHANTHGKLEVVGIVQADFATEMAIHRQLRPYRAEGHEWYHPEPAVLAAVETLLQGAA